MKNPDTPFDTTPAADRVRILTFSDIERDWKLSRSSVYRRVEAGTFPAPVRLGPRRVGWFESDVIAWALARRGN